MSIASYRTFYLYHLEREWFFLQAVADARDRDRKFSRVKNHISNIQMYTKALLREVNLMSKKSPKKVTWRGYANISIPATRMKDVEAYIKDDKLVWQRLGELIQKGYSIKFKSGSEDGQVRCNLYCDDPDSDNAGMSLGAWATDWYTALAVAQFKHYEIAEELWDGYEASNSGGFG